MYLGVDVAGPDGGSKHQVSDIVDQDGVATESGLPVRQDVVPGPVYGPQTFTVN